MRKIGIFILMATIAAAFTGCGAPAGNTPANNSNTNTAKPMAAAPTAESLLALDRQANEAYLKGDGKFFETFLNDKFAMVAGSMRIDKAMTVKMVSGLKCEVKDGWTMDDPKMTMIDADTYALTYKGTFDGSCTSEGKTEKLPSPIRAGSVYVRSGDKWQGIFHGENLILDPKNPPAAPAKSDAPKDESKKEEAKKDDKTAPNSNSAPAAPAAPAKSANTDALVAVEKSGWEAWMAKDARKLDEVTAKNLTILTAEGTVMNRADAIKYWTEMPCENVKTVNVTDGFGTDISATVAMLTFKGSSDGTCYGQKNGTQEAMSVYVKEGGAWKLVFAFSAAPMPPM